MSEFSEIHVTCASKEEAARIGRTAVEKWLAACAQVSGPITSVYRWKEEVREDEEWLLTLKTRACLFDEVSALVAAEHSYEVPQITAVPLDDLSPSYEEWLAAQIR
ncbi:MAG: divalent-cation tolerance protein CutA [Thermoguttaceae bacterium]|nr:divalent-cation tolerance protein CutA [Thermoguttaceae bacterium]MBR5415569.1 divalent-cation tolerance protein CutA [Thermoguttaceae bacterium]MBR6480952.1 divalent-cation tolerance protein CutA [Thermoguttaceae bacterium]